MESWLRDRQAGEPYLWPFRDRPRIFAAGGTEEDGQGKNTGQTLSHDGDCTVHMISVTFLSKSNKPMYWVNPNGSVSRIRGSAKPADHDCHQAEIHHIADPTDGVNRLEAELEALRTAGLELDPLGDLSISLQSLSLPSSAVRAPDFITPESKAMRVTRLMSSASL